MLDLDRTRSIIRDAGLSAWLLCNVFHRDEIADLVLDVPRDRSNTRPWYCLLFPDRPPALIVHRVESTVLSHLPFDKVLYSTRAELETALSAALPRGGNLAADYSRTIPVGSYLDHGTALLLESLGAVLVPAEGLVARYLGTVDEEGLRSHEAAAAVLYRAVDDAWGRLSRAVRDGRPVTEGEVQEWIGRTISDGGLEADSLPIVGFGRHTNDPHFAVTGRGAAIAAGDLVQFDLWGKQKTPGAVYADISWAGVCGEAPSALQQKVFEAVRDAREAAVALVQRRLQDRAAVTGADVDRAAREVLISRGFERGIRHRTGHSIGARVHGYGVNLDSVEFPDERPLTEGACFSVEPGVYLEELGMRTEIDCLIHEGRLHIPGPGRQSQLLTLGKGR